jgi:hypothetical protein
MMDGDLLHEGALLKRAFCVLEILATLETNGSLLVCGPALTAPAQIFKLADLTSERVKKKVGRWEGGLLIDCGSRRRWCSVAVR